MLDSNSLISVTRSVITETHPNTQTVPGRVVFVRLRVTPLKTRQPAGILYPTSLSICTVNDVYTSIP